MISVLPNTENILNNVDMGIAIFDAQGRIIYVISCLTEINLVNQKYKQAQMLDPMISRRNKEPDRNRSVIAHSAAMQSVLSQAAQAAQTDASVLLLGESGTGKEGVAQYIHRNSLCQKKDMVSINCASLPESLLEAELFGYEKGVFTGASSGGKIGLIEAADNSSLMLDEINSMPLVLQAKLLRVLETRTVVRVGAIKPRAINFRLICASNVPLAQCVKEGTFRSDLFYRLNVIPIIIPPLQLAGQYPGTAESGRTYGGHERVFRS